MSYFFYVNADFCPTIYLISLSDLSTLESRFRSMASGSASSWLEEIRLTSWYGKYSIIYRVLKCFRHLRWCRSSETSTGSFPSSSMGLISFPIWLIFDGKGMINMTVPSILWDYMCQVVVELYSNIIAKRQLIDVKNLLSLELWNLESSLLDAGGLFGIFWRVQTIICWLFANLNAQSCAHHIY